MKWKSFGSVALSLGLHLVLLFLFLFLTWRTNQIATAKADSFWEVSFVYDQEQKNPPTEKKTVLARKQVLAKQSPPLVEPKDIPKSSGKAQEKVNLPEVEAPLAGERELVHDEIKSALGVDNETVGAKTKPAMGSAEGVQAVDLNPSGNVVLFGPIFNRNILYSEVPEYPNWARARGIESDVRMRIWVAPDGSVSQTTILKKSGYLKMDLLVEEALQRWKFTPLSPDVPQVKQWGEILIRFLLY